MKKVFIIAFVMGIFFNSHIIVHAQTINLSEPLQTFTNLIPGPLKQILSNVPIPSMQPITSSFEGIKSRAQGLTDQIPTGDIGTFLKRILNTIQNIVGEIIRTLFIFIKNVAR